MTEKTIDVEGILYYTLYTTPTHASATAPLVLLSHALMSNNEMWKETTKALLSNGYRVLAYDHIGHNKTGFPTSSSRPSYHFDDFTKHMRELVRAITGSTKVFAIIGCSMGGVLALRYAMLYPGDVETVISCDAPGLTALEGNKSAWSERIELFEKDVENGDDVLCRKTVERWFPGSDEETIRVREEALVQVKTCRLEGYKVCADAIRNYSYTEELNEKVKAQCMVLRGKEDSAIGPEEVLEDVAKRIKDSEYVVIEGAGHLPPMHRPKEFNEKMITYLNKRRDGKGSQKKE